MDVPTALNHEDTSEHRRKMQSKWEPKVDESRWEPQTSALDLVKSGRYEGKLATVPNRVNAWLNSMTAAETGEDWKFEAAYPWEEDNNDCDGWGHWEPSPGGWGDGLAGGWGPSEHGSSKSSVKVARTPAAGSQSGQYLYCLLHFRHFNL